MKTLEEFRGYFENEIKPVIEPLENERIKVMRKSTVAIAIMIIIPIFLIIVGHSFIFNMGGDAIQFIIVGYIFLCGIILYWFKKSYVSEFKDKIIERIVTFFDSNFKYEKACCIRQSIFEDCKIFNTIPNRYSGDDYVRGFIVDEECLEKTQERKGTNIEFSEIDAERETGSGKNRHVEKIFKGLFFIADYNKNFTGFTKVIPDYRKNWLFGSKDRVALEDPEFEKLFEVYSTDQIEARYILTPSLMDRLKKFKQKTGRPVYASFKGDKIHIAIQYNRNLFEPDVFKTLYDFAPMQQYFEDLQFAISIVEELNLNTRIWSKQ
ncbi:MAG TPA: hypothetical protein DCP90_05155 [Clostridiales bacterium]|nr:MAG: hypothetical protein A2Y22_09050 [Clostridiales bacterium GWD2_32_59]HAN09987.1 hypothetical protein [Clostridiales bacterium]